MKEPVDKGMKKKKSTGDVIASGLPDFYHFMYLSVLLHYDLLYQRS